jgi:hypothetical protein
VEAYVEDLIERQISRAYDGTPSVAMKEGDRGPDALSEGPESRPAPSPEACARESMKAFIREEVSGLLCGAIDRASIK